jgi:hypothetical protein
MGKMASDQDRDNWNDQVKDCRTDYAHPIVLRPFIGRLIDHGYLVKPAEWHAMWPEEGAMSDVEKLAGAKVMISLNDNKRGDVVVTANEVREFIGKEPFTQAELDEQADERAEQQAAAMERLRPAGDDEEEEVEELAAALKKAGGTLTIAVRP